MMSSERKGGYQKVANKKDLKEGGLMRVDLDGRPIVLAMVKDKIYAMDAVCSHEGGPLEDGTLEGHELKCPWHYAVFDVRNAKVSDQTVWATDLQSYPVQTDEETGDIRVSLQARVAGEETIQEESMESREENTVQQRSEFVLTLLGSQRLEGTDIMTFRFTKDGFPNYKAGQFAFFPLEGVNNDPKGPVRHFSLTSSPTEDQVVISTRIRDSPYKQKLASLKVGTEVKVSKPQGNFTLHDDQSKPAVLLSGGIGVTPFRSMVKFATDKQLPLRITMFDSNRNQANILYKEEFDGWLGTNKNLKIIYTVSEGESTSADWKGEIGRINKSMLIKHLTNDELNSAIFYICGPPAMLHAMDDLLTHELNVPNQRIRIEEFTGY